MSAKNKAIIEKANDTFRRNDVEALLALCKDDFTWTMVGSEPAVGKAAVREWMAKAPPEPPKFTVDTVVADGDYVACIGTMTMDESGSVVPYAYCDVWRLEGEQDRRAACLRHQDDAVGTRHDRRRLREIALSMDGAGR